MHTDRSGLEALLVALDSDPDLARRLHVEPATVLAEWTLTDEELGRLDRRLRRHDGPRLDELFAPPESQPARPPSAAPAPEESS